ncbi:hypothetical protein [Niabella sp.]|uniref:hypothetical protein n=1 Tax=Niabella sp. TaxID=1962976 RepID=UPI00260E13F2|nr:hypothetical protein [Niabella sp.]
MKINIEDKLLEASLRGIKPRITDDMVEYYRQYPGELDQLINKGRFSSRFLAFFFVLGLLLTISVRVLKFFFEGAWGAFIDQVLLDVISEIGIAVFGGALTVDFLEHLQKKQYQESIRFRKEIKLRIQQLEKNKTQ